MSFFYVPTVIQVYAKNPWQYTQQDIRLWFAPVCPRCSRQFVTYSKMSIARHRVVYVNGPFKEQWLISPKFKAADEFWTISGGCFRKYITSASGNWWKSFYFIFYLCRLPDQETLGWITKHYFSTSDSHLPQTCRLRYVCSTDGRNVCDLLLFILYHYHLLIFI